MKRLVVLLFMLGMLMVMASNVSACSCIATPSVSQMLLGWWRGDVIATGVVVEQEIYKGATAKAFLKLDEVYKGEVGETVNVIVPGPSDSCSPTFELDERYLFRIYEDESGFLYANRSFCGNNSMLIERAGKEIWKLDRFHFLGPILNLSERLLF